MSDEQAPIVLFVRIVLPDNTHETLVWLGSGVLINNWSEILLPAALFLHKMFLGGLVCPPRDGIELGRDWPHKPVTRPELRRRWLE